ncbi:MAG: hypothetical protein Q7T50_08895 [Candidatus Magasanikbacteria bacterium]|nr:hypothetical protein [Candidatus Magasanikbacteria bacterium]
MSNKLDILREQHPLFVYESFSWKKEKTNLVAQFSYKVHPDILFSPQVEIVDAFSETHENLNEKVIDNLVFHLGLIEMPSYWKATCSPKILIKCGSLNEAQINWWQKLIINGLGEFFYKNKINFKQTGFLNIEATGKQLLTKDKSKKNNRSLVLIGGGKDSIVSLEFLKQQKQSFNTLILNPDSVSIKISETAGNDKPIVVKRNIDPNLLKLNENSYFNGHTPFSAYLAFVANFCAYLFDYKYVISSNERSSDEENIVFLNSPINHQYTKSKSFEQDFRKYSKEYLSEGIEYFSLLRPLYEIQISKIFTNYSQYFQIFRSCNVGRKEDKWCEDCPKCLSVFMSLYPYLSETDLQSIFQSNLYEKIGFKNLLLQMVGKNKPKPFECILTYEEAKLALSLAIEKNSNEKKELPILLKIANDEILSTTSVDNNLLSSWGKNFLPANLERELKKLI